MYGLDIKRKMSTKHNRGWDIGCTHFDGLVQELIGFHFFNDDMSCRKCVVVKQVQSNPILVQAWPQ